MLYFRESTLTASFLTQPQYSTPIFSSQAAISGTLKLQLEPQLNDPSQWRTRPLIHSKAGTKVHGTPAMVADVSSIPS
jgi:hypothetical protein